MPNSDFQRHSFLGGEVSPSLYERADMEKFGKWFSNAENIRFRETGAFRNRSGFVKIADTKFNTEGQIIKLLSFAFNDEEAFVVELGPNYARFYRNGLPIMNGAVPYELETSFASFDENDIKYAQAGDTIFITHPQYGIYELARLQANGSNWEWRKFNAKLLPMKEENTDESKTMSLTNFTQDVKTISLANPVSSVYNNVSFTFDGNVVYTATTATLSELYNGITTAIGNQYRTTLEDTTLSIASAEALGSVPDFSITFNATQQVQQTVTKDVKLMYREGNSKTSDVMSFASWQYLDSIYVKVMVNPFNSNTTSPSSQVVFEGTKSLSASTIAQSAQLAIGYGYFSVEWKIAASKSHVIGSYGTWSSAGASVDFSTNSLTYTLNKTLRSENASTNYYFQATIRLNGHNDQVNSYTYNSVTSSTTTNYYLLTCSSNEFANVDKDDCVLVKHAIDTNQLTGSYNAAGTYTLGPVRSDGNWRFYTLGNWKGHIVIQYSTDNQQTWVDYYEWSSQDTNDTPANINTSGSLIADDLVWFRVVATVTATGTKPLQVFFTTNSFEINSYYKVLFKNSDSQVVVECVKNDVGLFTNKMQWRLPAFSSHEGWPQTVAFYQNRLFFGKDYIVYGSRSNDFWDFYEPVKLQADDPITMSLLSQKVNNIRNLVTQRSFFTFTAGGEFGIGSEGALTQSDKYLKPFSANGSAPCNPVLISDKVLFVDKSYNSIRALQYSLEADGYEAPDITLTLRALLENERIISTDIIYEEKEALFLSNTGIIWVLKYITDQNVLAWSHWRHAAGKITNICVVPNGAKHDLYIAVEDDGKKWIELLNRNEYMDTVEYFNATSEEKVSVTGSTGDQKIIIQGNKRYKVVVDGNGQVDTPEDTTASFKVGSAYVSDATMLAPVVQLSEYHHGNYEVKTPFKVFFYYLNSYGFKVGVNEDEKMPIKWIPADVKQPDNADLTSGKKSVLIPSRFEDSARVSFVQDEPFPMEIADVLIQTDYGGK